MRSSTFGVPLEDLMGYNGEKGGIPRVVKDTIQFLRDSGMSLSQYGHTKQRLINYGSIGLADEGLFRRSPSSVMLRTAQDAYDRGRYSVCSLLTTMLYSHSSLRQRSLSQRLW